jgi:hypothetical protein
MKDLEEGGKYSGCSVVVKPRTAITAKIVCNAQPMLFASPAQKAAVCMIDGEMWNDCASSSAAKRLGHMMTNQALLRTHSHLTWHSPKLKTCSSCLEIQDCVVQSGITSCEARQHLRSASKHVLRVADLGILASASAALSLGVMCFTLCWRSSHVLLSALSVKCSH